MTNCEKESFTGFNKARLRQNDSSRQQRRDDVRQPLNSRALAGCRDRARFCLIRVEAIPLQEGTFEDAKAKVSKKDEINLGYNDHSQGHSCHALACLNPSDSAYLKACL